MRHLPETIRTRALGLQARLAAVPGRALAAAVTLTVVVSLGALLTATVVAQPAPAPLAALETPAVSTPTATPTLTAPSPAPTSTPAPTATSTPAPAATQSSGEQPYVAARRIGTGPGDVPVFEVKFYDFPEGTSAVWESITAADGRVVPVGKTITIARSGHTILETITGVSARFLIGERRFDVRTDPGSTAWSTARGVAPVVAPASVTPGPQPVVSAPVATVSPTSAPLVSVVPAPATSAPGPYASPIHPVVRVGQTPYFRVQYPTPGFRLETITVMRGTAVVTTFQVQKDYASDHINYGITFSTAWGPGQYTVRFVVNGVVVEAPVTILP